MSPLFAFPVALLYHGFSVITRSRWSFHTRSLSADVEDLVACTLLVLIFAFAYFALIWFIVLLPLYLWVPLHSRLWRQKDCILWGAFIGFLIGIPLALAGVLIGALSGAAAGLFAYWTRDFFNYARVATPGCAKESGF